MWLRTKPLVAPSIEDESQHGLTFMTEPVINGASPFMVDYTFIHPIYCMRAAMHAFSMKRNCKNNNMLAFF